MNRSIDVKEFVARISSSYCVFVEMLNRIVYGKLWIEEWDLILIKNVWIYFFVSLVRMLANLHFFETSSIFLE